MAATGFTPISLYYSATPTNVPLAANLVAGELALNTADGKLYYNDSGTVKLLASNAATTNASSISFGSTGLTPATSTTGAVTVAGTLSVLNGGTGVTSSTGTGSVVLSASPTFTGTVSGITAAAVTNTPAGNIIAVTVQAAINELDAKKAIAANFSNVNNTADANKPVSIAQQNALDLKANALQATRGLFSKADSQSVAFTKLTAGTAQIKAGTYIDVNGTLLTFAAATTIVMPTLTAGTDYAIYVCQDGTIRADASFSAPSGYTTANSRKIGGFHYAPGGNAAANAGGDTTPAINQFSFWDLKFKPSCLDPRGIALVADGFWADIYLMGVDHLTNGTSKYNVTIADGASPPKIPTKFGGNGSSAYGSLNWWEAAEVLAHHGKRPPSYSEFAALAFGTTEASGGGTDPGSTILRAAYTSKWGVMLASGNLHIWGANFGGGPAAPAWTANTVGRGSTFQMENSPFFGGSWSDTPYAGSRCSLWNFSPTTSSSSVSARGVCDLLILE